MKRMKLLMSACQILLCTSMLSAMVVIPQSDLSVHYVDSEETAAENGVGVNAIDDNSSTIWLTEWSQSAPTHPHEIQIYLGASYDVEGIFYMPRQDSVNGRIADYEIYVSTDGSNWGSAVAAGTWPNSASLQVVTFDTVTASYVRLVALSEVNSNPWTAVAELNVAVEGSPTIALNKSSYYSGEDITITWSEAPVNVDDRVALYLSCFAPTDICEPETGPPLAWADISRVSGQATIDNVLVPGDYTAVYLNHGSCAVSNFVNFSVSAGPATGRDIEPKMLLSYCDGALADPQIYKEGSTYYITGTYAFYNEANPLATMYYTDDFDTVNSVQIKIETPAWGQPYQHMWAFEIYKHTDGTYHGYGYCYNQGAIYHFEPYPDPGTTTFPVLHWKANELLLSAYDNRVIHDGSDLYMMSSVGESGHQKIFAQRMTDPGTMDSSYTPRRIMSENGDGLVSELRNRPGAMKIHECPYIIEVNDGTTSKWVMSYAVGDYAIRRYKIGFGYSDVMIPPAGTEYSKVTKSDTLNVWGSGVGANEVLYVTQTEKPSWPNYHAAIYGNPGSGDIFEYNGSYYMLFHATQPMMMDDMVGGSGYFGRSLWVVPLDFDFSGSMDTWAALDLPDGQADPVLTPNKATFDIGEDIVINFENAGQGPWDEIKIYNDGDPDGSPLDWKYVQGQSQTFLNDWAGDLWAWEADTYGFSGSMTFAGLSAGDYNVRTFHSGTMVPSASSDFSVVAGGGSAVSYPDSVTPGVATAQYAGGVGKLENDVITFDFEYRGGQLQDMIVKPRNIGGYPEVQVNEPFVLTIGGVAKHATDLTVTQTPTLIQISADPSSVHLADHYPGWKVQMKYRPANNAYEIVWEAILRDESNYVRQEISVTALSGDIVINDITMVDMDAPTTPGPAVVGNDAGCPVVADNYFLAYEHPITWYSIVGNNVVGTFWRSLTTLSQGDTLTQSSVVGLVPEGQLRRGFLYYLERERARPYRQYLHYNSWFDITHSGRTALFSEAESIKRVNQYKQEMVVERGVTVDGFVMDDPWDDPDSVWQFNSSRNPQEWQNFKAAAEDFGASTGVWMSPFGGYGNNKARRLAAAAADPVNYETANGGFQLSGPNYNARYRQMCFDFINNQGVKYFKFDGIGGGTYQTGPAAWAQADYEALFDLIDDLRDAEPDVFVNATIGSWHSPFYLMYADSIWRDGVDTGYVGDGGWRGQNINYRDRETYQNVANASPLFPLSSLMTHGVILAPYTTVGLYYANIQDFTDDVHSYFGMGMGLQEMYIAPDNPDTGSPLMTEDMWDILSEAAKWSRENQDVFADAHWVGGNPGLGEVYGVACWNPRKATLMLRNPSSATQNISIDVDDTFELPNGAEQTYYMKSPWAADVAEPVIQLDAGTPYQFTLAPQEVVVLMSDGGAIPVSSSSNITESFLCDDAEMNAINVTPKVSAATGYSWRGYAGDTSASWLHNMAGIGSYFASEGSGESYEGVNAWTIFDDGVSGADHIADLMGIRVKMAAAGYTDSGTVSIEAIIQDANGDWFVSNNIVSDTAGSTGIIDAASATWRTIATPVIGTAIVPGAAGTPDLSKVYGGGVNFRDLGTGYAAVRIESLTFAGDETDVPTPSTASFAVAPVAITDSEIMMVATTGTDLNGPVEYYFNEISGNPGGTDSGWTTNPVYYDMGLNADTQYTYTVRMRDSALPTPNLGATSSSGSATTNANSNAIVSVTEGFNPGNAQSLAINAVAQTSIDTGYTWGGRHGAWGLVVWDNAGEGMLEMSGVDVGYDSWNAWSVFDGDHVMSLQEISFAWHLSGASGNFNVKAIIKDATGNWFVSDDTAVDTAGTTQTINATTTTWKKLNTAPLINTRLDIGSSGTPDLSRVYGGGLHTVGLAVGTQTRLDTLTFTGGGNSPPAWNSDPMFKAPAIEGLDYAEMLQTLAGGASDPDVGDVLTYSLVSAPSWLTVASDGQLSGIAADDDTGSNAFTVRVTDDDGLYDDAILNVYAAGRYTGELGLSDLTAFAGRWLDTDCGTCGGTDLNNDGDVNMQDWAIFAGYWLK